MPSEAQLFQHLPQQREDAPTPTLDRLLLTIERTLHRQPSRGLGWFRYYVSAPTFVRLYDELEARCWKEGRVMWSAIVDGHQALVLRGVFVVPN